MNRVAIPSILLCALVSACSSDDSQPAAAVDAGKDVSVIADTAGQKTDGLAPADVSADPPPGALADTVGREEPPGATDLPLDISCMGAPMPVKTGEAVEKSVFSVELGDDMALVPETSVEIFYSNTLAGAPDATLTTAATTADGKAKITPGFISVRTKKTGMIDTVAYDWWVDTASVRFAIGHPDKVAALGVLIGGAEYAHVPGTGRLVLAIKDCKRHDLANVHVVLEVDGKVVAPTTKGDGVRRNYFGDNELPGKGTVTSRAGVVAFLNVPAASPVRLIAYGKTGGAVQPIGIRTLKPLADGVVTAYVTPWIEP